jgi:hypothetical protein
MALSLSEKMSPYFRVSEFFTLFHLITGPIHKLLNKFNNMIIWLDNCLKKYMCQWSYKKRALKLLIIMAIFLLTACVEDRSFDAEWRNGFREADAIYGARFMSYFKSRSLLRNKETGPPDSVVVAGFQS